MELPDPHHIHHFAHILFLPWAGWGFRVKRRELKLKFHYAVAEGTEQVHLIPWCLSVLNSPLRVRLSVIIFKGS